MRPAACVAAAIILPFTTPLFAQKVIFKDASRAPHEAELIESYGTFKLYKTHNKEGGVDADYMNRLLIDAYTFDTQKDEVRSPNGFGLNQSAGKSLQLVQFVGPIKQEWLHALEGLGIEPVHYVARNGYLVWADQSGRDALEDMVSGRANGLQFTGVYHSFFKVGPTLLNKMGKDNPGGRQVTVTVQMLRHADSLATEQAIAGLGPQLTDWTPILGFQNARFTVRLDELQSIANRPDVYWIGEYLPRELHDEVQAQIVAGNFNGDLSGPSAPGYLAFLDGLGFSHSPADYPIVDVVDDGIGTGSVNSGDPTLHEEGNGDNATRLSYVNNCTDQADGGSIGGHGHINVSIAGGYDDTAGFPFTDPNGYLRGLGINPYGRMAGTRIFDPDSFDLSGCGGSDQGLIKAVQDAGAQIATNSWGCSSCAGSYDESSQAFDVGVRDADLTEGGNQELIVLFSAGNEGPTSVTVGTPGNGKNMITVGASENFRPADEDGSWTDGCGTGPAGADDAMDVIGFSSRGPAPGNRVKPEVIAPGTHIQGTASTNSGYSGSKVCDQFRPSGQATFAASSGTSHSTPALAGVASLAYYWIENQLGGILTDGPPTPPSPAMMKSYMIAHPTYLSGNGANDTLPSNSQGYGQPTLNLLFDGTLKFIHDQATVFDNSGEDWTWVGTVADPTRPVRIVLAYTDQAGAVGTSPQVNDLNLSVDADGTTYLGNNFSGQWSMSGGSPDADNNYEAVFLPAGTASAITITVDAFNIAGDGVPNQGDGTDQDFALTCYNCVEEPTFSLSVVTAVAEVCAPDDAIYELTIGSILGFTEDVTLSTIGAPAGLTPGFSVNPVTPPGASTLTLSNTASGTPGTYTFDVQGVASPSNTTRSRELELSLFDAAPSPPAPTSPADGALNVATDATFQWSASAQEQAYTFEIADDPGFGSIEFSTTTSGTSVSVPSGILNTSTSYYWRVRASNTCGDSAYSGVFDFTTVAAPGDCDPGSEPVLYFQDDMESGVGDWTHSAPIGDDTWVLNNSDANSPTMAWNSDDYDDESDQRLVSPDVVVPPGVSALTLQFWTRFDIEDRVQGGCWDAGILEYSTNGGTDWTQVDNTMLDTLSYTGQVRAGFNNPLAGLQGWCGEQAWIESVVDLSGLEGETLNFRFRLGTDRTTAAGLWHVDDVVVQSCEAPSGNLPWRDGFEDPNP